MKKIKKTIQRFMFQRFLNKHPDLKPRFLAIKEIAKKVRSSEYHLTNKCNIRCKGCWFFSNDFDTKTEEMNDLMQLEEFVKSRSEVGQTAALLIGGEPTLFPEKIQIFQKYMPYVTISTNGLKKLPYSGFENVAVPISLFGGGELDDRLRAYGPTGKPFSGLFEKALANYRNDPRAYFMYAVTEAGIDHIEPTVRAIRENGNRVHFNYYIDYARKGQAETHPDTTRLIDEVIRVSQKYPETVLSHPYFIKAMILGRTEWGEFNYESCPSLSVDHEAHQKRKKNGNPVLPGFNTYGADMKTIQFCCTSGSCDKCHDATAVGSWLMVSLRHFMKDRNSFLTWIEITESYWKSFVWSPLYQTPMSQVTPSEEFAHQAPL